MSLDVSRLEKVKQRGEKITARCPACAEDGGDRTGCHLSIEAGGGFTCIQAPGPLGKDHRRRIAELVGKPGELPTPTRAIVSKAKPAPYRLSEQELFRIVGMSEELYMDKKAIGSIADARGWQPETIRQLALDPCLGLDGGKLVYVYETGVKKRFRPLTPSKAAAFQGIPFSWLFGKPDSLWRGDRACALTETIHITEGETTAITLIDAGIDNGTTEIVMAVACASGWRNEWAPLFQRRQVVLWPDSDTPGQKMKEQIVGSLAAVARSIKVVNAGKGALA